MRKAGIKDSARQPLNAGRGGPAPHADRHHARRQQQHVAALQVLKMRHVEAFGASKPRVMLIDHLDQLGLPGPPGCGQTGGGGPVADPEARIPAEDQVRERVNDEVVPVEQLEYQASPDPQLGWGQACDQDLGQGFRI